MKIKKQKFDGTFVLGISFSNYKNTFGKKSTSLIFDLGNVSLAFIFRGEW